jgi:predicted nuclease of predicted toxin-antitoxin system
VLISKDQDFLFLANAADAKARFIWIRFPNCRTTTLLAGVENLSPRVEAALEAGDRVIELR